MQSIPSNSEKPATRRGLEYWLPGVLVLTGIVVYLNSFPAEFVWDDTHDIVRNRRIQSFWTAIAPPWGGGSYRPVVYLSFALNYAWGGLTEAWGYRAVNLAVHLAAGLALYGIIRRTLLLPIFHPRFERSAPWIAVAAALLWTVHPLQTESVTYIVHRYESFMGLFYLLTLYCVLRGATSPDHATRFYVAAVLCCALGMGSKEVMVTAPVLILIYDRVFLARSWKEVRQQRLALHLELAATWLILWFQVQAAFTGKEEWAGFNQEHLKMLPYALSQPGVILYYLGLAVWPQDLCVDIGWRAVDLSHPWPAIVVPAVVIGLLLAGTLYALFRWPWLGFLGLWFFVILAPTSSVMPVADLAAERRMYLPLAALAVLAVLGSGSLLEAARRRWAFTPIVAARLAGLLLAAAVVPLGLRTIQRNLDYYTEEGLWRQVVAKRPQNSRGHANLAVVLINRGQIPEAIAELHTALSLSPSSGVAHQFMGTALERMGKDEEAMRHYVQAVRDKPNDAQLHNLLGRQYQKRDRLAEARQHYSSAVLRKPEFADAHNNLGTVLWRMGQAADAKREFFTAITLKPDFAPAYDNLAVLFWSTGEGETAMRNWHRALSYDPGLATAHNNLGAALALQGKLEEAMPHLGQAIAHNPTLASDKNDLARIAEEVRNSPDTAAARDKIGMFFSQQGRFAEARPHFQAAIKERPRFALAHDHLAVALWVEGKQDEALRHWKRALELDATLAAAHNHLGAALAIQDQLEDALKHFDEAVRLDPTLAEAHHHRGVLLARQHRLDEAVAAYRRAVELRPKTADYRTGLAHTLKRQGNDDAARKEYEEAIRADPAWPHRTMGDAWILSVHPDRRQRNGRRALQLAQRVCDANNPPNAIQLDVLAAAYAENGRFDDAIGTIQKAIEQANRDGLMNLAAPMTARLALYREKKPFRVARGAALVPGS